MDQPGPKTDPAGLAARVAALPGLESLRSAGEAPVYLVGGAVRDLLLGRETLDVDVVVEGDAAGLARRLGGEATENERFRTARVRLDGLRVDLASARAESYARPGALPVVRPASLAEDLARRDFSINAMAFPLGQDIAPARAAGAPDDAGGLIDPHGGLGDLEAGVLRTLHPGSFVDDPTRALRAARYAARFVFRPDPDTEARLRATDLDTVSADRVEAELRRLAAEPRAAEGFELLDAWGLRPLPAGAGALIRELGELLTGEAWSGFADRVVSILAAAAGRVDAVRTLLEEPADRPSRAVELASGFSPEELALARAAGARWLDEYVARWRKVRLEIDGADLIAAGVPEGPAIGRGLAAALAGKLDGEVSGREAELAAALAASRGQGRQ